MPFAFNPDDGPPRLIRFVEPGTLPDKNLLAIYVKSDNLLIVDRKLYDTLSPVQQKLTLRTHKSSLTVDVGGEDEIEDAA